MLRFKPPKQTQKNTILSAHRNDLRPEEKLLYAILRQAWMDIKNPDYTYNRKCAIEWVLSNNDDIHSFIWVCNCLQLDPEQIKRKFMEVIKNASKGG